MNFIRTTLLTVSFLGLPIPITLAQTTVDPANRTAIASMHREMADLHKKVADCLASDRPMSECQQQLASACNAMHGKMGQGKGMHGMMGDSMMKNGMMGSGMAGCPMMGDTTQPPPAASVPAEPKK